MKGTKEHAKETQKKVAKGKGNYLVKMFKEKSAMAQKARVAGKPAPAGKKQTSSSGREGKIGNAISPKDRHGGSISKYEGITSKMSKNTTTVAKTSGGRSGELRGVKPRAPEQSARNTTTVGKAPTPARKPSSPSKAKKAYSSAPKKTYKRTVAKDSKKFNYQKAIRKGLGSRNR